MPAADVDTVVAEHTTPGKWHLVVVVSADGAHAPTRGTETCGRDEKRGAGEWREVKGFRAYIAHHDRIVQVAIWHRICDEEEFGKALANIFMQQRPIDTFHLGHFICFIVLELLGLTSYAL